MNYLITDKSFKCCPFSKPYDPQKVKGAKHNGIEGTTLQGRNKFSYIHNKSPKVTNNPTVGPHILKDLTGHKDF